MTVKEILADWLKKHGYDGLCYPRGECGCGLDDFIPCQSACELCEPAYMRQCFEEEEIEACDSEAAVYNGGRKTCRCFGPIKYGVDKN
jgi:hypothetical protein